jgi:hypothetical protein
VENGGLRENGFVTTGLAEMPPNKKEPPILIPAVWHPANLPNRLGSVAIHSVAIRPAWYLDNAPNAAPIPMATASIGTIAMSYL